MPIDKKYKNLTGWNLKAFKKDQLQRSIEWQKGDDSIEGLDYTNRFRSRFYFEENFGLQVDTTDASFEELWVSYNDKEAVIKLTFALAEQEQFNGRRVQTTLDVSDPDQIENLGKFLIKIAKSEKKNFEHSTKQLHWLDDDLYKTRKSGFEKKFLHIDESYETDPKINEF